MYRRMFFHNTNQVSDPAQKSRTDLFRTRCFRIIIIKCNGQARPGSYQNQNCRHKSLRALLYSGNSLHRSQHIRIRFGIGYCKILPVTAIRTTATCCYQTQIEKSKSWKTVIQIIGATGTDRIGTDGLSYSGIIICQYPFITVGVTPVNVFIELFVNRIVSL
jgi:hypothetical protein